MLTNIEHIKELLKSFYHKGFYHLLSANALTQIVAFASQLLIAGIISPDDLGRIKIIQTYAALFTIVAGFGFNASTLKLCAENDDTQTRHHFFSSAFWFTFLSSAICYLLAVVLNQFNLLSSDTHITKLIPLGFLPVIETALFAIFISYFQAIKRIKTLSGLTIGNKLLSMLIIVVGTFFMGIKGYYIAYNSSLLIMLILCLRLIRPVSFKKIYHEASNYLKKHLTYAKPSVLAYLLSETSAFVDILLINYLCHDIREIGFYSFAVTVCVVFRLLPSTVQQISIPYLTSLQHDKKSFCNAYKKYNRLLIAAIVVTLAMALVLYQPLLHFIFQTKYDGSISFFPFIAIGWSFRQAALLQTGAVFSLGKIKYNTYTSTIGLVASILSIYLGIHFFGLMGACYGAVLSGFILLISSYFFFKKSINRI